MSIEPTKIKRQLAILIKLIAIYRKLYQILFGEMIVVLHHSATDQRYTTFNAIDNDHRRKLYKQSRLGNFMAYNALITYDGKMHIARAKTENGLGTSTCPKFHYDLCLTGNFNNDILTAEQEKTLREILDNFVKEGYTIKYHQNFFATDCCGSSLIKFLLDNGYTKVNN